MSDEILKQQEMAAYFGNLLSRVRKIEKFIKNDVNSRNNSAAEAAQTGNPFNNPFVFFATEVTSIVDSATVVGVPVIPQDDVAAPWIAAGGDYGVNIVPVTVPSNVSIPAVGDTIMAHFTGVYQDGAGDNQPRYGVFGAGGGGNLQTVIKSISDDHLVCRSLIGTVVGAEDILVAKNYLNRMTPFDGLTVGDYTYAYSTTVDRVVTIAASTLFQEIQTVIPRYAVDDVIYATQVTGEILTVTVAGTPVEVDRVDMNVDCREFVRTGFKT